MFVAVGATHGIEQIENPALACIFACPVLWGIFAKIMTKRIK